MWLICAYSVLKHSHIHNSQGLFFWHRQLHLSALLIQQFASPFQSFVLRFIVTVFHVNSKHLHFLDICITDFAHWFGEDWVNLSKRGGKDGVFRGLAGLLRGISQGRSPREIPKSSPASPRKTPSFPTLLLRFTFYFQHGFSKYWSQQASKFFVNAISAHFKLHILTQLSFHELFV